jgi:hypothetical protein
MTKLKTDLAKRAKCTGLQFDSKACVGAVIVKEVPYNPEGIHCMILKARAGKFADKHALIWLSGTKIKSIEALGAATKHIEPSTSYDEVKTKVIELVERHRKCATA